VIPLKTGHYDLGRVKRFIKKKKGGEHPEAKGEGVQLYLEGPGRDQVCESKKPISSGAIDSRPGIPWGRLQNSSSRSPSHQKRENQRGPERDLRLERGNPGSKILRLICKDSGHKIAERRERGRLVLREDPETNKGDRGPEAFPKKTVRERV